MPKYVIHIGPPKTGSKYLQSHLFHLRDLLLRDGICYPDNWWTKPDQIMHSPLLAKLQSGDTADLSKTFAELNATGHKVIVLSCEGFDDLSAQHLEPLGEASVRIRSRSSIIVVAGRSGSRPTGSSTSRWDNSQRFPSSMRLICAHRRIPPR
jgi:hypothetical protein